ncbi:hypothetical protein J2799_002411 [Chryseobacterium vietnamense]|jgi:hypothetical protein|uniref:hypothetical protein n=1 Tax=Chryseobacterium vietnamense TaxID=866785 RepID=UPI002864B11C|nr:hypothetical protein [Chryseobacterium vietnamense]MDR6487906.1 hypothetical protein [Chryseobacterium vietnamense]
MTTKTIELDLFQENIKHLSTDELGNFIAITSRNRIVLSDRTIPLELGVDIVMAKIINEEKILIVLHHSTSIENALIIDYTGRSYARFNIGTSINDIKINGKKIIVSYFDEGVLRGDKPDCDALAVFNHKGEQVFGFNSGNVQNPLIDCYCAANLGNGKIVFNGYGNFLLQELDLNNFNLASYKIPPLCIGARSVSAKADNIIFHSTYEDKTSFFIWNLQTDEFYSIDSEFKNLQSTENGIFYQVNRKSFTIINPLES